jgi:hypothetical protein
VSHDSRLEGLVDPARGEDAREREREREKERERERKNGVID